MSKSIDPALGKRYLDVLANAGEFLEDEKVDRLRAMTDDEARDLMPAILAFPLPADLPERTSGLAAQQRWFQKLARKP